MYRTGLGSDRQISVTMALVFLPWLAVVLYTAGVWAAVNFVGYAIIVFAIGYGVVSMAVPATARTEVILLAPALGILAISALTAFWLRLGLPLIWAPAVWLGLVTIGAFCLWRDRDSWIKSSVTNSLALALLSVLICAICFLPSASNDMVQRRDGSFNWKYIDTQYFHAMVASIKTGESPPKTPGTVTAELLYHFGPYTPAAVISCVDQLDLGDAVARVTRGASIWALLLSCFALGTLLSIKATGAKFGAITSVAGLFFYGPLLLLIPFDGPPYSSGNLIGSLFFKTANERMLAAGIPYDHLLSGHSVLHGLGAITAIMGLCLAENGRAAAINFRSVALLALPALAVPVHPVAALYCLGVVGILMFWGRLGQLQSWLPIIVMSGLFLGAWMTMGYGRSQDAAQLMLKEHPTAQWWMLLMWFLTVLGFRIVGLCWISQSWKEPISALFLATIIALLAFTLLLSLKDANEKYGIYFLQCMFSIFAFSRLTARWWFGTERLQIMADWLRLAIRGMILFVASGFLIGVFAYATHTKTGINYFVPKLFLASLSLAFLAALSGLMRRSHRFSRFASGALAIVLMSGFLAWSPDWVRYAMGRIHTGITYSSNEVRGLRRLDELMAPGEVFATNKHDVNMTEDGLGRSYGYSALSGRPVLLEGYVSRSEYMLPWFSILLHDNDALFSTTDPTTLRDIASKWHVRFLVARPGTDIALPRPLPRWLIEQQDCGDLRIYRVD
ncbi:MAG TPA: hypothetical protein VMI10_00975 [Terriglobales bacterium]|nr:hypothetical protein [Terriglobales bacterium]